MAYETFGNPVEQKKGVESDIETMRVLTRREDLLRQRWNELSGKAGAIESNYPLDVKFDNRRRYKSDASFLTPEDKEAFMALKESMARIESERNELGKELLKKRFDLGVTYLAEINQQEGTIWQETNEHTPDPQNNLDNAYARQWRAKIGDAVAEINMTGELKPSLFEELQQAAEALRSVKVSEAIRQLPEGRELEFSEIHLSFSISPASASQEERDAIAPSLLISKQFDSYAAEADVVKTELPMNHTAYAVPTINAADQQRANDEMVRLAKKLGVTSF